MTSQQLTLLLTVLPIPLHIELPELKTNSASPSNILPDCIGKPNPIIPPMLRLAANAVQGPPARELVAEGIDATGEEFIPLQMPKTNSQNFSDLTETYIFLSLAIQHRRTSPVHREIECPNRNEEFETLLTLLEHLRTHVHRRGLFTSEIDSQVKLRTPLTLLGYLRTHEIKFLNHNEKLETPSDYLLNPIIPHSSRGSRKSVPGISQPHITLLEHQTPRQHATQRKTLQGNVAVVRSSKLPETQSHLLKNKKSPLDLKDGPKNRTGQKLNRGNKNNGRAALFEPVVVESYYRTNHVTD
ncbi:uncharacterized protein PAC_11656 [Phialocephala subalpina]|uniref:Uncharacterized protein n=1 Tax=Phialocephala subalpina TaxID=576137 RepID=A0A1L7X9R2_9HELO|nr:uncharacterized protein PAC_11656 [Phialocephala subalpina]